MAVSRNPNDGTDDRRRNLLPLSSLSRYDVVLVLIPLSFAAALVGHLLLSVSLQRAVAAGAVVGVVSLLDALVLNPPTEPPSGDSL